MIKQSKVFDRERDLWRARVETAIVHMVRDNGVEVPSLGIKMILMDESPVLIWLELNDQEFETVEAVDMCGIRVDSPEFDEIQHIPFKSMTDDFLQSLHRRMEAMYPDDRDAPDVCEYLDAPHKCPWCEAQIALTTRGNIEFEDTETTASDEITCLACGKVWQDMWTLTGMKEMATVTHDE